MKKIFYFMSLFLGLLVCSSAFVACGDDDDSSSDSGKYAGNRIVGTWQWGDPEMSSEEHHHHNMGYIFKANGDCENYMVQQEEEESWGEYRYGTYTINGIKLVMTWTKVVYKEHGETFEKSIEQPQPDECEIMYPKEGNVGMFLKRYYMIDGRQGWSEEGPFYKL